MDFDDLLSRTVELFRQAPEVRSKYQNRFIHVMVDEFQDTNTAQYEIAREIAGQYRNLAVVGDPDQAIYSWRNADIRNILSFKKDYPDASGRPPLRELPLDLHDPVGGAARHTLGTASASSRELFTHNGQGAPVRMAHAHTEDDEAQQVVREVQRLMKEESATLRGLRRYLSGERAIARFGGGVPALRHPPTSSSAGCASTSGGRSRTSSPTCVCCKTPMTR